MAGDVVIIGRPVGVAADRDEVLEPKRAMVSAANDLDYRYESEIDMDELRRPPPPVVSPKRWRKFVRARPRP